MPTIITDNARGDTGNERDWTFGPYMLDTLSPTITFTGPATTLAWLKTPQSIDWSVSDPNGSNGSGIATGYPTLQWDSGSQNSIASSGSVQIPEGKHAATIRANDVAGNSSSKSGGEWWIDTCVPVVSLSLSPASPDGDHTVSARAADVAGNSSATQIQHIKVDATAPVFASVDTDAESRSLTTLVATWSCSDDTSGVALYEYSIYHKTASGDELIIGPVLTTNPWAYETNLALADGESYYFAIRAKNGAGLWSDSVVSQDIVAVEGGGDASPNFNSGGVSVPDESRTSPNYKIVDSLGQFVIATSESPSFVIEHGYWHSDSAIDQAATPGAAKSLANGKTVQLGSAAKPVVVTVGTSTFTGRFYAEGINKSSGIAVSYGSTGGPTLVEGDTIYLVGKLNTIDGERVLQYASATLVGHIDPLSPLYIGVPRLGGGAVNEWTPGVLDGFGLNNVGLLVKTYGGIVSYQDPQGRFFYLDNGDNLYDGFSYGLRIICDGFAGGGKLSMPAYGKMVVVTGISDVVKIDGVPVRAIHPRKQTDIQILN